MRGYKAKLLRAVAKEMLGKADPSTIKPDIVVHTNQRLVTDEQTKAQVIFSYTGVYPRTSVHGLYHELKKNFRKGKFDVRVRR